MPTGCPSVEAVSMCDNVLWIGDVLTDWIVTRLAWMAHRLVSSKSETRYDSTDSWRAPMADDWKRRSDLKSWAISRTCCVMY